MERLSGQYVKAINVANVPAGMIGVIEYCDLAGRLYVQWNNGRDGVIRERGDRYSFVNSPSSTKKLFWKLKRIVLFLRNN